MDLQAWASIASIAAVGLAIVGVFTRQIGGLKGEIGGLRTELKSNIAGLRSDMKAEFGRVGSRLNGLEQRTFELSTRLPPLPTRAE